MWFMIFIPLVFYSFSWTSSYFHSYFFFIAFVVWLLFSNQYINNNLIIISFGSFVFFMFIVCVALNWLMEAMNVNVCTTHEWLINVIKIKYLWVFIDKYTPSHTYICVYKHMFALFICYKTLVKQMTTPRLWYY